MGLKPGPKFKKLLGKVQDAVDANPNLTKQQAMGIIKKELQGKEQVMKNKYEKIFTQEEEDDAEINYPYELKKANIVISNLIEQRNIALDKLAMIRAEAIMLNDELIELKKEEIEKEEPEEEKEEESEPNAEEQTIYCIELYQSRLTDATRMS